MVRSKRPEAGNIPKHIVEALKQAFPDGLIGMPITGDEASFWETYPKLQRRLSCLKGVSLIYERKPQGEPQWNEGSNPDEDPPGRSEDSRSYHLFFLCPNDSKFTYETEEERPKEEGFDHEEFEEEEFGEKGSDEEGLVQTVAGHGTVGCSVAISLVAPLALITPDHMESFEDGSRTDPNLGLHVFTLQGEPINSNDCIRDLVGEKGLRVLHDLSRKIAGMLQEHEIAVLSPEDLRKPVPWLRGGEEVFVGAGGEPVTLQDALFFEGL